MLRSAPVLLDHTQHEANREGAEDVIGAGGEQGAARHQVVAGWRHQSQKEDDLGHRRGSGDPADLLEGGDTAPPHVEAGHEPCDEVHADGQQHSEAEVAHVDRSRRELEAGIGGGGKCDEPEHCVDGPHEPVPVAQRRGRNDAAYRWCLLGGHVAHP